MEMEEYVSERQIEVGSHEVRIEMSGCNFTWGFKVSQEAADDDKNGDSKDGIEQE